MADDYTPSVDEIVMGKTHLGDNFWRELSEDEVRRGIAQVRAEALREAADEVHDLYFGGGAVGSANRWGSKKAAERLRERADRIEKEADQ